MEHKTNKKDKNEDGRILSDHEPSKKARITSQKELKRVAVALKRREGHGQFLEDRKVSKGTPRSNSELFFYRFERFRICLIFVIFVFPRRATDDDHSNTHTLAFPHGVYR